jgi:hypothetical protein
MPARAAFVLTVSAAHRPQPDTELAPPAERIDLRHDPEFGRTPTGVGAARVGGPATEKRWKRVGHGGTP